MGDMCRCSVAVCNVCELPVRMVEKNELIRLQKENEELKGDMRSLQSYRDSLAEEISIWREEALRGKP